MATSSSAIMPCYFNLERLPPDLLIVIIGRMPLLDRPPLAAINRRFRTILHPVVARQALEDFPYLLIWAAREGLTNLVRTFLEVGGDPNVFVMSKPMPWSRPGIPHRPGVTMPPGGFHPSYNRKQRKSKPGSSLHDVFMHGNWTQAHVRSENNSHNYGLWGVFRRGQVSDRPLPGNGTATVVVRFHTPPGSGVLDWQADGTVKHSSDPIAAIETGPQQPTWYFSALHQACLHGHGEIAGLLIHYGADINASSLGACRCHTRPGRQVGGRSPGSPEHPLFNCWTALHLALCSKHESVALLLLSAGASTTVSSYGHQHAAILSAVANSCPRVVEALLVTKIIEADEQEPAVTASRLVSYSLLDDAESNVTPILLRCGFRPDVSDENGLTALHVACIRGHLDAAKELVRSSKDVDGVWECPPAYYGSAMSALEIACLGPAPIPTNIHGLNYISGNTLVKSILSGYRVPPHYVVPLQNRPPLSDVSKERLHTMVDCLIIQGANVHPRSHCEHSPLVVAVYSCQTRIVQRLLQAGAEADEQSASGLFGLLAATNTDLVPYILTSIQDRQATVRCLLEHGAHANQRSSSDGVTALAAACRNTDFNDDDTLVLVRVLLEFGANPNLSTNLEQSALMIALQTHKPKTARALVDFGADSSLPIFDFPSIFNTYLDTIHAHNLHYLERGILAQEPPRAKIEVEDAIDFTSLLIDLDIQGSLYTDARVFWRTTQYPSHRISFVFLEKGQPDLAYTSSESNSASRGCLNNVIKSRSPRHLPDSELELIDQLIARGADVNQTTPLCTAIGNFKWEAAQRLLDAGAVVPLRKMVPVLMLLVGASYFAPIAGLLQQMLKHLFEHTLHEYVAEQEEKRANGEDVEDFKGLEAEKQDTLNLLLMRACKAPTPEVIEMLLDAGADVNFGGPTNLMVFKPRTPVSRLFYYAPRREDEDDKPIQVNVPEQLFRSFRVLCKRGAVLQAPPHQDDDANSGTQGSRARSGVPNLVYPLQYPQLGQKRTEATLVEKVTTLWPSTDFRKRIRSGCDFMFENSNGDTGRVQVVFREQRNDKLLHQWRRKNRRAWQSDSSGSDEEDDTQTSNSDYSDSDRESAGGSWHEDWRPQSPCSSDSGASDSTSSASIVD